MHFGCGIDDAISSQCGRIATSGDVTLCIDGYTFICASANATIGMRILIRPSSDSIKLGFVACTHETGNGLAGILNATLERQRSKGIDECPYTIHRLWNVAITTTVNTNGTVYGLWTNDCLITGINIFDN